MAQNYTKDELHREMRQIHDEIKKHPFRVGFETQYIPEYKHLLYELSRKWSDLIWHCSELTDEETRLYRQFGGWIHDYRQELRTYHKDTFPMDLFPYYEQMAEYADALVAFWDGKSKGTKHMIETARKHGLKVRVVPYVFEPIQREPSLFEREVLFDE